MGSQNLQGVFDGRNLTVRWKQESVMEIQNMKL